MRLDRLVGHTAGLGRRAVRERIAAGEVSVAGQPEYDGLRLVGRFETVALGARVLQSRTRHSVLLHKPAGFVSATTDPGHPTVVGLINEPWADELHLAGRLDRATTGLVVLTNDSAFSESLTRPGALIPKTYHVTTDKPVSPEAVAAFRAGMRFAKEGVTTAPAEVEPVSPAVTRLTIFEGKHHQVKRMFLRFGIRVTALHRESVGCYSLENLAPGEYRLLDAREKK